MRVDTKLKVGTRFFLFTPSISGDTIYDLDRSRYEHDDDKGHLQSRCYALRNAGSVVAAICGALVYNRANWGWGLTFSQVCGH